MISRVLFQLLHFSDSELLAVPHCEATGTPVLAFLITTVPMVWDASSHTVEEQLAALAWEWQWVHPCKMRAVQEERGATTCRCV